MAKAYSKTAYSDKLKDPRWQKLRLEVMQANEFRCELCMDSESTLHVHHKAYIKGCEPWDYEKEQLACLCENCHDNLHSNNDLLEYVCSFANMDGPRNRDEIAFIIAGHLRLPVKKIIEYAEYEEGPWTSAMYETGSAIQDIEEKALRFYIDEYTKKRTPK